MTTTPRFTPALSNLTLVHQGKTRDTFATNSPDTLLIVATNRLSTHDVIHLSEVPQKGEVLTGLTVFWLTNLLQRAGVQHHLVACGKRIYEHLPGEQGDYPPDLHHRAIVVKVLQMIPVEFIYRGYLVGSLWKKFYSRGKPNPYGIELPEGLQVMAPFEAPIFTPSDKSETDDPLNTAQVKAQYPRACPLAAHAFTLVRSYLRSYGLELVDSKFEIGVDPSSRLVTLADEIATPDSSRFCDPDRIKLGTEPPWLDKQIARDEAERIWGDDAKHPLEFSEQIIKDLSHTYLEIFWKITRYELWDFQRTFLNS